MTKKAYAFVLDNVGNKLSPTLENKAWYLIRKKKAKLVRRFPLVIQLQKEVPVEDIDTTPIILGVDDGSKFVGIGLVQACKTRIKPIFKATMEQRLEVHTLMKKRAAFRRKRRYYKRGREARYNNRASSSRAGRLTPTIKQKRESIIRVVKNLSKYCRINKICLEDVAIDIRALTEGHKLYEWQYRISNRLDENLRRATLLRDNHTCLLCGSSEKLEAHHITPRRLGGADSIYNLGTVCRSCHIKITGREEEFADMFYKLINGKKVNTSFAQHVMQGKYYLREELLKIAPLQLTTGADTANRRIDCDIEKSHANDALIITGLEIHPNEVNIKEWHIKPFKKRTNFKTKELRGFKQRDVVTYTKKDGTVYIGYVTTLLPKKNKFSLQCFNGKICNNYPLGKKVKLLYRPDSLLYSDMSLHTVS